MNPTDTAVQIALRCASRPAHRRTAWRATALAALLAAAAAQAEPVRKCVADGRVVFQSTPCAPTVRSGNVLTIAGTGAGTGAGPAANSTAVEAGAAPLVIVAATDPTLPARRRTLAEVLRERDGTDRPRAPVAVGDGANVLRSRMGAL